MAVRLGQRLAARGKPEMAVALLTRAAAAHRDDPGIRYALADAYADGGKYDQRYLAALADAVRVAPPEYEKALAVLDRAARGPARAELMRAAESKGQPADAALSLLHARLEILDGKPDDAVRTLEQAIQSSRGSGGAVGAEAGPACAMLAQRQLAHHQWAEAIATCREAQKAGFHHTAIQLALARGLEAQDDFDGAEA